jgi:ribosomal protein S18 acetylase RimI-like enzyme
MKNERAPSTGKCLTVIDLPLEDRELGESVIRRVRDDELSAILRLWLAAGVTPPSISDSIEGLTKLIREPAALLFVAAIDEQLIGSVIGGWDGWRGNIYRLAVTPEWRRRGIARRLVETVSVELFAKGATRLSALVEHEHHWAIKFWDSINDLGYRHDPQFTRYIIDQR